MAVRAFEPETAFIAVQRADEEGGAHCWGALGVSPVVSVAGSKERRAGCRGDRGPQRDPQRPQPDSGAHIQGDCRRYEPFGLLSITGSGVLRTGPRGYHEYHGQTRSPEGMQQWLADWVIGVADRRAYLAKVVRIAWMRLGGSRPSTCRGG